MKGIIGKKIGMSQVYNDRGEVIPVTMIKAGPCVVLDVKEKALRLGFEDSKEKHINKPQLGEFKKANVSPKRVVKEIPFTESNKFKVGDEIKADIFAIKECVDVRGRSIGKGFQGGMKRWGWHGGPSGHGSMHHRRIGSMGSNTDPGRVLRGLHMPGHMGYDNVCIQNLEIINVNDGIITIKGSVPGKNNNYLVLTHALKMPVKRERIIQKINTKDALKASKRAARGKG